MPAEFGTFRDDLELGGSGEELSPPAGTYCIDLLLLAVQESDATAIGVWVGQIAGRSVGGAWTIVTGGVALSETSLESFATATVATTDSAGILRVTASPENLGLAVRWHCKIRYLPVSV